MATVKETPPTTAKYVRLGKSGARISTPIFGAMGLGAPGWVGWGLDEKASIALLKQAWDKGITTFDTANTYANGLSETIIGNFMRTHAIHRKNIFICTKAFDLVGKDVSTLAVLNPALHQERDYVNQAGNSRVALFNQLDDSLKRLGTDYVDLLQLHRFDPATPMEETMKALHDLVMMGKVRYIGASSMHCWQFAELNRIAEKNGWTQFTSMQAEHSLLYREEEREMIPYCNARGIAFIAYGPLANGSLARPNDGITSTTRMNMMKGTPFEAKFSDADSMTIMSVDMLAKQKNCKMSQVALAWSKTKITAPIIGLMSAAHLEDSLVSVELSADEIAAIEAPYIPKPTRGFF